MTVPCMTCGKNHTLQRPNVIALLMAYQCGDAQTVSAFGVRNRCLRVIAREAELEGENV